MFLLPAFGGLSASVQGGSMSATFRDLQDLLSLAAAYEAGNITRKTFWANVSGRGFNKAEIAAARKMQRVAMDNGSTVKAW